MPRLVDTSWTQSIYTDTSKHPFLLTFELTETNGSAVGTGKLCNANVKISGCNMRWNDIVHIWWCLALWLTYPLTWAWDVCV